MSLEIGKCIKCGKQRRIFYNNMCQCCYKSLNDKYCYYRAKEEVKFSSQKHRDICFDIVKYGYSSKELAQKYNMNTQTILLIRRKYLVKCDKDGNLKGDDNNGNGNI